MKSKLSYGYLLPSQNSASLVDFSFSIGDIAVVGSTSDEQPWDYESPVTCHFSINIDKEQILQESGLSDHADKLGDRPLIGIVLSWFSTKTKLRGSSTPRPLSTGINELTLKIDGQLLGGSLIVNATIALLDNITHSSPSLAPRTRGTILWSSDKVVLPLEGSGPRLAMSPINFKKAGINPSDALWLVQISEHLDAPASSAIRILINTSNPITMKMLENPNTPESNNWQKEIETELLTLLINRGASQMETTTVKYEEGSLGETISVLINALFPFASLSDLSGEPEWVAATVRASVFNRKEK